MSAIPALVTSEMPFIVGYLLIASTVLALAEGDLASAGGQAGAAVAVRQALKRDEEAIAVWKAEVWPDIKGRRATWAPTSTSRTRQVRA